MEMQPTHCSCTHAKLIDVYTHMHTDTHDIHMHVMSCIYMLIWLCDMHAHTNAHTQKHAHTKIIINIHLITIYVFAWVTIPFHSSPNIVWLPGRLGETDFLYNRQSTYTEIFTSAEIHKTNNITTEMQSHTFQDEDGGGVNGVSFYHLPLPPASCWLFIAPLSCKLWNARDVHALHATTEGLMLCVCVWVDILHHHFGTVWLLQTQSFQVQIGRFHSDGEFGRTTCV